MPHGHIPAVLFPTMDSVTNQQNPSDPEETSLDLQELQQYASIALTLPCVGARHLASGSTYDVFVLSFAVGDNHFTVPSGSIMENGEWTCIARVAQSLLPTEKLMSEIRTMEYITANTDVPVPRVYFHSFDADNPVGAQLMLVERLPGKPLYEFWDELSLDHKMSVVSNMAYILARLSWLRFDKIGCLGDEGNVGPLLYDLPNKVLGVSGPFSTTLDYLISFLQGDVEQSAMSEAKQ